MENLTDIDILYNAYKKNIILISSLTGINTYKSEDITCEYIGKSGENPWISNETNIDKLYKSIEDNGMYWLFVLKGNEMYEGKHRFLIYKELKQDIFGIDILNKELSSNIELFYFEKKPENVSFVEDNKHIICIYNSFYAKKPTLIKIDGLVFAIGIITTFAASISRLMYDYKQEKGEEYPTSLLCNNYDCLKGAVEHYKETGEFIIDNDELTRLFIDKNANI